MKLSQFGWIVAGILFVVLIVIGILYYCQTYYKTGFNDGYNNGQIQIIKEISSTSSIPYFINETQVGYISFQQLCKGG